MTSQRKNFGVNRARQFGAEYEQLLLTIWKKTPFRFPFETDAGAKAMRNKIYAYFRHLREENLRLDLVEMADSLTIRLEGNVLILMRNEETWDHDHIRALLGLTKDNLGLTRPDGQELQQPDLLGTRLSRQLTKLRERSEGGQTIVTPMQHLKEKD